MINGGADLERLFDQFQRWGFKSLAADAEIEDQTTKEWAAGEADRKKAAAAKKAKAAGKKKAAAKKAATPSKI